MHVPLFVVGLISAAICICFAVITLRKTGIVVNPENRGLNTVIFVLSVISLVISIKLFWNMGVYMDEFGSSPTLVCGGWFWLYMDWIRLGLLLFLTIFSGFKLIKRS